MARITVVPTLALSWSLRTASSSVRRRKSRINAWYETQWLYGREQNVYPVYPLDLSSCHFQSSHRRTHITLGYPLENTHRKEIYCPVFAQFAPPLQWWKMTEVIVLKWIEHHHSSPLLRLPTNTWKSLPSEPLSLVVWHAARSKPGFEVDSAPQELSFQLLNAVLDLNWEKWLFTSTVPSLSLESESQQRILKDPESIFESWHAATSATHLSAYIHKNSKPMAVWFFGKVRLSMSRLTECGKPDRLNGGWRDQPYFGPFCFCRRGIIKNNFIIKYIRFHCKHMEYCHV